MYLSLLVKLWDIYKGKENKIIPTLDRIKSAVKYIGNPQKDFPSILIGGTNGKGSTCAFLEKILRYHGFKTGWFVSPHLVEENERWRINGTPMEKEILTAYIKDLRKIAERFELTYFEFATLIALVYFKDNGVDIAVMEVGMGGRWDATKVANTVAIGITNAERDHTRWLGKTVEEIAQEKLQLYVKGKPLVLGSCRYPLYTKALELGYKDLITAGIDFTYKSEIKGVRTLLVDYVFSDFNINKAELGLMGKWQADNAALAITLSSLFVELNKKLLFSALSETRWEGRMEIVREKPLLLVDGSHNPYAINKVVKEVNKLFENIDFVFTGLSEKDWRLSMEIIRRYKDKIYLVQISHPRGESVKTLKEYAEKLGFRDIQLLKSPEEIWFIDRDLCALGSLYLVGEIKEAKRFSVI